MRTNEHLIDEPEDKCPPLVPFGVASQGTLPTLSN